MLNRISRRTFLASVTSTFAIAATPLLALTEAGARGLIDGLVVKINSVIASGKSEAGMIREFQGIFNRYADVPIMAQYALGVDGRSARLVKRSKVTSHVNTASASASLLVVRSK